MQQLGFEQIIYPDLIKMTTSLLNTPGFIKFWIENDFVETKYNSIAEIPLMTLNRTQTNIQLPKLSHQQIKNANPNFKPENIVIVHCKKASKCEELSQQLIEKNIPRSSIYKIPDQNNGQDFANIEQECPGCLSKMTFNGKESHPIFKFLKKNCPNYFYDYNTNSSVRDVKGNVGMFIHSTKTSKTEYYNEKKLQNYFQILEGTQKQKQQKKDRQ